MTPATSFRLKPEHRTRLESLAAQTKWTATVVIEEALKALEMQLAKTNSPTGRNSRAPRNGKKAS